MSSGFQARLREATQMIHYDYLQRKRGRFSPLILEMCSVNLVCPLNTISCTGKLAFATRSMSTQFRKKGRFSPLKWFRAISVLVKPHFSPFITNDVHTTPSDIYPVKDARIGYMDVREYGVNGHEFWRAKISKRFFHEVI